jgi:pilus assembly protein Flp/PilA
VNRVMKLLFGRLRNDSSGATAIEYAFIAMFISLTIVVAARSVGNSVSVTFNNAATALNNPTP